MMQGKGLVFVTGDRLGDQLTALLEEAGCQVVRGLQPWPPALTTWKVMSQILAPAGSNDLSQRGVATVV
jgi:hypothetical protein